MSQQQQNRRACSWATSNLSSTHSQPHLHSPESTPSVSIHVTWAVRQTDATLTGGTNAPAFTVGRNDDAFAFSLFTLFGDNGPGAPFVPVFVWILAVAGAAGTAAAGGTGDAPPSVEVVPLTRFPLNGGIGCINMLIRFPLPSPVFAVADDAAADDVAADEMLLELFGTGVPGLPEAAAAAAALAPAAVDAIRFTLRLGAGAPPAAAATVLDTPIARAWCDSASLTDFSLILRCFSSSLARIGTRSSGIGLLSCIYHDKDQPRQNTSHDLE